MTTRGYNLKKLRAELVEKPAGAGGIKLGINLIITDACVGRWDNFLLTIWLIFNCLFSLYHFRYGGRMSMSAFAGERMGEDKV